MLAKRCDVLIYHSNLCTINKNIYEHEIPVIEAIFGDGSVTRHECKPMVPATDKSTGKELNYHIQSDEAVKYDVEEVDHDEEYMRMFDLYGKHKTINIHNVSHVYGRIEDGKMEAKAKELYKDEQLPKPDISDDGNSGDVVYGDMSKMQLKEMLNNLKVPYPPNATKPVLVDYAERYDRGELELEKVS